MVVKAHSPQTRIIFSILRPMNKTQVNQLRLSSSDISCVVFAAKKAIYSVTFTLTHSAGNELTILTQKHIGHPLQASFGKVILTTAIIQTPLGNNFMLTNINHDSFNNMKKMLDFKICPSHLK